MKTHVAPDRAAAMRLAKPLTTASLVLLAACSGLVERQRSASATVHPLYWTGLVPTGTRGGSVSKCRGGVRLTGSPL